MFPLWRRRVRPREIAPDEIFIDASNIPAYDREQFEGRLERPIEARSLVLGGVLILLLFGAYGMRAFSLMVVHGASYAKQAAENQLSEEVVFADRGIITDRAGRELAYNERLSTTSDFAERTYSPWRGIAHVVGYAKPPLKDTSGVYYQDSYVGIDGAEEAFNDLLAGANGRMLKEVNARGELVSQSTVESPRNGEKVALSIDAPLSQALYDVIAKQAEGSSFQGGAGVIMDVRTGEVLSLVSYPEFPLEKIAEGDPTALSEANADKRQPFLDRAVDGLYAPGSIVKPIVATAALEEGVIDENTQILSTGSITIPNPYDPANPSIFRDWKAHGWVDMRHALAVSSDVYFYEVGGGYGSQKGLGIAKLDSYFRLFGFGEDAGLVGFSSKTGTIPTPEWKEATFNGDPWRLGNTYHTSIGQYGLQVTPLQMVRAVAAIGNGGTLLTPTLLASSSPQALPLPIEAHSLQVAREGMQLAASPGGTAAAVALPFITMGAKTGTAQVGAKNEYMNSWIVGFFPYDEPRYAFAVVLEKAPAGTLMGAPAAMNTFFWWLHDHSPGYLDPAP